MSRITAVNLKIQIDNEAFGPEPGFELARLLRQAATRLERCPAGSAFEPAKAREGYNYLFDDNGNSCGWFRFGTTR